MKAIKTGFGLTLYKDGDTFHLGDSHVPRYRDVVSHDMAWRFIEAVNRYRMKG